MVEKFNITAVANHFSSEPCPQVIVIALVTDESGIPVKGLGKGNFSASSYGCIPGPEVHCGLQSVPIVSVETKTDTPFDVNPFYIIEIKDNPSRGIHFGGPSALIALTVGLEPGTLPSPPEGEILHGAMTSIPAGYTVINSSQSQCT